MFTLLPSAEIEVTEPVCAAWFANHALWLASIATATGPSSCDDPNPVLEETAVPADVNLVAVEPP